MRRSRRRILACVAAAWVSMLLGRLHPFGDAGADDGQVDAHSSLNAGANATQGFGTILARDTVPAEVRVLLTEKCADCHSMQTRMPLYGKFAPASWLMERDILEARKHMNLSAWDSYSPEQRATLKARMAQEVKAGTMPPPQYLLLHWNAHVSEADVKTLQQWAQTADR